MKETFIGAPTKEEIEIYLKQKQYSLLNMTDLRSEILLASPGRDRKLYKNFFEDTFCESKNGMLQEKTNKPMKFFYEAESLKHKIEKSGLGVSERARVGNKALKKLTIRNTQKNTGYRYVKLYYKSRKLEFGGPEIYSKQDSTHFSRVKWSGDLSFKPHNTEEIKSILKSRSLAMEKPKARKKTRVVVETRVIISNFGAETDFKYSINK